MQTRRIHPSLRTDATLLGAERELVLASGVIAFLIAIPALSFLSVVIAVIFWTSALVGLRWMAKTDVQFSKVFRRHMSYARYHPAKVMDKLPAGMRKLEQKRRRR